MLPNFYFYYIPAQNSKLLLPLVGADKNKRRTKYKAVAELAQLYSSATEIC